MEYDPLTPVGPGRAGARGEQAGDEEDEGDRLAVFLAELGGLDVGMYGTIGRAICGNPNALRAFRLIALEVETAGAGNMKQAVTEAATTSMGKGLSTEATAEKKDKKHGKNFLPPELTKFTILKEMPVVAQALQRSAFAEAQQAVQDAPNDPGALAALRNEIARVVDAYRNAIDVRIAEKNIKILCKKVIDIGNADFKGVYGQVWKRIPNAEDDGVKAYAQAVKQLRTIASPRRQCTSDPCELFQHAGKVKDAYAAVVHNLVSDMDVEKVSIPAGLKKMGRIVEKTLLKRRDDPGNADKVCDIVRGMVTCFTMDQVAEIVRRMQGASAIVVTRVKDRFLTAPSAGGWRDCMINFYLREDPNKHICEVQLVHTQLLMARKGLPGHDVYNRVRNADEIAHQWMRQIATTKKELETWLVAYQEGDTTTRGAPNEWDVSRVTDMSHLFNKKELKKFNEEIGDWDVSQVTNMEGMFKYAYRFNKEIGNWDVSQVTNMEDMFYEASDFNQPLSAWNVSQVTNMKFMFCEASDFNQPLSTWNVSQVTNMENMFEGKFNQPLSEWILHPDCNVGCSLRVNSKVIFCELRPPCFHRWWPAFKERRTGAATASNAKSIVQPRSKEILQNMLVMWIVEKEDMKFLCGPPNGWDVSKITDMSGLFSNAWLVRFNDNIGGWDVSNVVNMENMFAYTHMGDLPSIAAWNVSQVINMKGMFRDSFLNQSLSRWKLHPDCDTSLMFHMNINWSFRKPKPKSSVCHIQ